MVSLMNFKYINPFFIYFFAFLVAMGLYYLKISEMYDYNGGFLPTLLILTVAISFLLSMAFRFLFLKKLKADGSRGLTKRNQIIIAIACLVCACAEYGYSGRVPIVWLIAGQQFDYREFGIPTFHVLFMSFLTAHSIVSFERIMSKKGKHHWIGFFTGIIYMVSIVSRGNTLFILLPCFLLYLTMSPNKRAKIYILAASIFAIIMFGVLGDLRFKSQGVTESNPIYEIGAIKQEYIDYGLPSGFTWVYIYVSSPYGNLIDQEQYGYKDRGDIYDLATYAFIPDFIAKHIDGYNTDKYDAPLLSPLLTVSTGYTFAYSIYGIVGIMLLFIYLIFICFFTVGVSGGRYPRTICAMLSSISALMIFGNMLIFSTCIMQIVLVLVMSRFRIGNTKLI